MKAYWLCFRAGGVGSWQMRSGESFFFYHISFYAFRILNHIRALTTFFIK